MDDRTPGIWRPYCRVIRLTAETMGHNAALKGSPDVYEMQVLGLSRLSGL